MENSEKIFVDKMIELLSKQFNRYTTPSKGYKGLDLFQNIVNFKINYVIPELKKHGITEDNEFYDYIVKGWIRDNYGNGKLPLPGDRIRLIKMTDDPNPIEPGTMGTVREIKTVDLFGEDYLIVDWDNGRGLHLIVGLDEFEVIEKG